MSTPSKDDALARAINHLAAVHEAKFAAIATALDKVALQLRDLGNGNAATQMGAIEGLSLKIAEAANTIASGMRGDS